jgi:glucokinase
MDLGGTWLRAALVAANGTVLRSLRMPTADHQGGLASLSVAAARELMSPTVVGVGLAVAGVVRDGVLVRAAAIEQRDIDFGSALRSAFGKPVAVLNDANAAALAESEFGAGRGSRSTVYVTIGTGVGGAIVSDGEIVSGAGSAGEFGHMTVRPDGPRCGCGGNGCWEVLASGPVIRAALDATPDPDATPAQDAADRLERLRPAAAVTALGIRNVVAALDPDVIVIGGGVVADNAEFFRLVLAEFEAVRPFWSAAVVRRCALGERAGAIGAARSALRATRRERPAG